MGSLPLEEVLWVSFAENIEKGEVLAYEKIHPVRHWNPR